MIRMAFNPFESCSYRQSVPLFFLRKDILDDVFVLNGLSRGRLPSVPPPIDEPISDAVNAVFTVGDNDDMAVSGRGLEGTEDSCQLSALVRLAGAGEGFGYIAGMTRLALL